MDTSTQRKFTAKRVLEEDQSEMGGTPGTSNATPDTRITSQRQALAEAISTAMSKGLEPLLAAKESKNKPTKYRGLKDGNVDGWIMSEDYMQFLDALEGLRSQGYPNEEVTV